MKRVLLSIGLILMLVASLFVFTGCFNDTKNANNGNTKIAEKSSAGVVGTWAYSSFVYTFNTDKTGTYDVSGTLMNFTYEDDGQKLSILFDGNTAPMVLQYRLDGNKLIITDSFGKDVEYVKQ